MSESAVQDQSPESEESFTRSINVRKAFLDEARSNGCNIQDMVACAMTLLVEITQATWPDDKDQQRRAMERVCQGLMHTIDVVEIHTQKGPKGVH